MQNLITILILFLFKAGFYLVIGAALSIVIAASNGADEHYGVTIVRSLVIAISVYAIATIRNQIPFK